MKINLKLDFGIIFLLISLIKNYFCSNIILEIIPESLLELEIVKLVANDDVLLSGRPIINRTVYISTENNDVSSKIQQFFSKNNVKYRQSESIQYFQRSKRSNSNEETFLTWDEYEEWIRFIKASNIPILEVIVIGKSFENRNIYSIKLGVNTTGFSALFESGSHAREWLSVASVIGTINKIIKDLKKIPKNNFWIKTLKYWNLYFIPILNPDGYFYSMKKIQTRFWRKNRQTINGNLCTGIDINRNYPIGFTKSNFKCQEDYSGEAPFTTLETQSFRRMVTSILSNLKLYLSLHCYGQFILLPWAYKNEKSEDYDDLKTMAQDIQKTIFKVGMKNFSVGTPGELLYIAGGTSFDWVKSLGVPYSYTIELSPDVNTELGFIVPESFIKKSIDEIYASISNAISRIMKKI